MLVDASTGAAGTGTVRGGAWSAEVVAISWFWSSTESCSWWVAALPLTRIHSNNPTVSITRMVMIMTLATMMDWFLLGATTIMEDG